MRRFHEKGACGHMCAAVRDDYVYLDYAATALLCEEAAEAMAPYLVAGRANVVVGGNANSLHSPGRAAFDQMEQARRRIAERLGASRPDEIVFTSGATEADNAAILGLTRAAASARRHAGRGDASVHMITTAVEHDAVLESARRLEAEGCRVTYLRPDARGFVSASALESAIDDDTVLVSVQTANSEVGSVQPVGELARIAHEHGALFHTDAVQALGKIPVDVGDLEVDAASFSAHKIGGPMGAGLLYLRARTPFEASALGGGQEGGRRSGTQNVCGIVGMAAALEAATEDLDAEAARLRTLRDDLYEHLGAFEGIAPTVPVERGSRDFLPNVVHVLVDGFESETLVLRLDTRGIGVSGGSACASHSLEPSHVLSSMGISRDAALGALRVSMGRYTTDEDVEAFLTALPSCLEEQ